MFSRERCFKLSVINYDTFDESLSSDVTTAAKSNYKASQSPKSGN